MIAFLLDNWLWIGVIVFFVAMHRGGHGCGMHGAHGKHSSTGQAGSTEDHDHQSKA